ncbi:MAG: VWA domain-containing protein [Acidobacteriota bacterium]|nr:VWA domain-containing protein [Acidobacteriota bacterium]
MKTEVPPARRWILAICCAALCGLLASTAAPSAWPQAAQPGPQQTPAGPRQPSTPAASPQSKKLPFGKPITTSTEMTLVDTSVLDPLGRIVTGLRQDNFRVFEDGVEQETVYFASDDVPVSIGVIFDMSGSMADKIQKSRNAAVQFFRTANPQDEFFLVDFNDRAELITPFTGDVDQLQNQLMYTAAHGMTALYDGVYLGLSQMRSAHHERKALLIISDGGDNHSRYTETDIRRFVQESDVQIYAIGLFEPNGGPTPEEQHGPALLADLTQLTGGRMFVVQNLSELPDISTKISMELRNQYVLGYIPSNRSQDGKWRKIKVRLRPPRGLPPLTVYAKTGYYGAGH